MASKEKSKSDATKTATTTSTANTLKVRDRDGKSRERLIAEIGLSPAVSNALTARNFAKGISGEIDLSESVEMMREKVALVKTGDLSGIEETLTAQAAALDAIFNELARRAAQNMGTYLSATETYLRMAMKAQAQCRATLETLAEVKYPKAATFVRQQNVAYQQQVNNGGAACGSKVSGTRAPAHAHGKTLNQSNELLEVQHGERMDGRATGAAGGANSDLEAVGAIDGADDGGGEKTR